MFSLSGIYHLCCPCTLWTPTTSLPLTHCLAPFAAFAHSFLVMKFSAMAVCPDSSKRRDVSTLSVFCFKKCLFSVFSCSLITFHSRFDALKSDTVENMNV